MVVIILYITHLNKKKI